MKINNVPLPVPKRGDIEMILEWGDNPVYDTGTSDDYVNLDINAAVFLKSDPDDLYDYYGTDYLDIIEPGDDPATGVVASTDEEVYDYYDNVAQESLLFTTIDDGTKYTNYNYMVFVWSEDDYLWIMLPSTSGDVSSDKF